MTVGDIGYLDDDGYLYLTDRRHHMIISGGVNIYPQEAENMLVTHPKVMDAAVFGIPDEEMGQSVKGVVQTVDPADATEEFAEELLVWLRDRLAHYKCPRIDLLRAQLPRTDTGKLYKKELIVKYSVWRLPARSTCRDAGLRPSTAAAGRDRRRSWPIGPLARASEFWLDTRLSPSPRPSTDDRRAITVAVDRCRTPSPNWPTA